MRPADTAAQAGLITLIVLQTVMLASLFAGIAPHPPATTPLFAMGPFLAASLALAATALCVGPLRGLAGPALAVLAALAALLSFGPQKYVDPQFPLIWPAVVAGQIAVLAILVSLAFRRRGQERGAAPDPG
ncbi:MAG: hypothetical protein AAGB15_05860 [Pseudomonadota bacterium]